MPATFLGVLNLALKTFSTTYVPWSGGGWAWQTNSLQPMEVSGRFDVSQPATIGFGVTVFDGVIGATKFGYGNTAGGVNSLVPGALLWKRAQGNAGLLAGWVFNSASTRVPFNFFDSVTLGTPKTVAALQLIEPFPPLPNVSNTGMPNPLASGNWYDINGKIQCSYVSSLNPGQAIFNPATLGASDLGLSALPFTTSLEPQSAIPYGGTNWLWCQDPTGGTPNKHLMQTPNYINSVGLTVPAITNPPGASIDLNAYINAVTTTAPTSTYSGWLWINRNALTITGQAFNGFGILVAPDFSAYYLINFVPVDATAAGWQGGVADITGKFDDTGHLWIKLSSSPSTIFVTQSPSKSILATFPPQALPSPPNDSQLPIRAMRGYAI